MSVQLRIVLDQAGQAVDADEASAAASLTAGLVRTAPRGCGVAAIVPSDARVRLAGLEDVRRLPVRRRELLNSWLLGFAPGVGGGLIHAPTLMAPLVRHDRANDNDQTTVTLWDLTPWERPDALPRQTVSWQRAMLKRAVRHADAVVVPTHCIADRLAGIAPLGDRIRVIAGAAPAGFHVPGDAPTRRAALGLPERYVVLTGDARSLGAGIRAAATAGIDAVVLDAPGGEEATTGAAVAAGLPADRLHPCAALEDSDRAAVIGGAAAFVATATGCTWPWRLIEAMHLGVPLVAVDCGVHRDVVADGGAVVREEELPDALADALGGGAQRLRVLAADRSRAFSWTSAAERVWALHAEL